MGKRKKKRKVSHNDEILDAYRPDPDRLNELASKIRPFAKVRVYAGYFFLLILLIFAKPNPLYFIIGTAFIMAGSFQRIMSAGTLVKAAKDDADTLIMTGPYSKTRHPLYFGSFLNGIGFVFLAGPLGDLMPETREIYLSSIPIGLFPWGLVPFLIILVPIYYQMIRIEEEFLAEKFGPLFERYKRIAPCFFPRFLFSAKDANWQFDPERVRANKEMRNFVWLMVAYVLFFAKMLYFLITELIQISA
jgi:protein-S-isoprenylcysteine O-methyltransferase Ste14